MQPSAVIRDVVARFPSNRLTNEALASDLDGVSAEEILERTGIRERRIAAPDECASDLAVSAAEDLFARGRVDRDEIDYVLFCTQSADHFVPTSACLIHQRLGLPKACGALDFSLGSSGYVFGLSLAKGLITSGQASCVLLLTGDTYTKYVHPKDRSIRTLFGDGATATAIAAREEGGGIGEFVFGTDGRGGKQLIVPAGGARKRSDVETAREAQDADGNVRSDDNLYMNGRDIFRFTISEVPKAVRALSEKAAVELDDVDLFVLHQASKIILDEVLRRLKIPADKAPYRFEDVGNTASSSVPIVLSALLDEERLRPGSRLMLVGFGPGYSWAACTLEW